jgi:hypothetical protein
VHDLATEFGIGPSGPRAFRRAPTAVEPEPPGPTQLTLL